MSGALREPRDFIARGFLQPDQEAEAARVAERYALAMTEHLAQLADPTDPADPIALQFAPDVRELQVSPQALKDPIGDGAHSPIDGLVHRYPDRVLVKLLTICAVYCRFCFRREMVGGAHGGVLSDESFAAIMDYIAARPQIWEVILTGGDPLALSPRRLKERIDAIAAIPHVKVIRIHTRAPIADPESVSEDLAAALRPADAVLYVAIHANHPRELSPKAQAACARLIAAGAALVSQTVLLAGVNDDPDTLAQLMRKFVEARIKPYYLHHLDLAPGVDRFRVSIARGRSIVAQMNARLSGLARPQYMLDIPGGFGKIPLTPPSVRQTGEDAWILTDARGADHIYVDGGDSPQ